MTYQQTGDTAKLVGAMMRLRHNTMFKVRYRIAFLVRSTYEVLQSKLCVLLHLAQRSLLQQQRLRDSNRGCYSVAASG